MFTLDGIRVRFGEHPALEIDHLDLVAGSTVAVMGPNGSGKTTLLRLLAGLIDPTEGRLDSSVGGAVTTGFDGGSPDHDSLPERRPVVAYVAQHQHQHSWIPLTVAEVLRMGRYRHRGLLGRLNHDDREIVAKAAADLQIDDLIGRSFGRLSGGQRQRVLMAMALANDADALLLDEPITGLDLPSQQIILDVLDRERDRGRLVVLSTHHLEEARRCRRVILLSTTVIADGKPHEVLSTDDLALTFGPKLLDGAG